MRRAFSDALISIGALGVLLLALVAVDDRVRDQVSLRFQGHNASGDLADAGTFAKELAIVAFDVARDQSISHAPMMIFVVVATVLVLFMLRT